MNDTRKLAAARYVAMDTQAQLVFLANLAHRLTIVGRDTYDAYDSVKDRMRLKAVNEAQHRVLGQLLKLLMGDEHRYPDDVFVDMLMDQLQTLKIDPEGILHWN
jgi:hypothetical protein